MSKIAAASLTLLLLLSGCAAGTGQKQATEPDKSSRAALDGAAHSEGHDHAKSPSAQSGSGPSPSHGGGPGPHK